MPIATNPQTGETVFLDGDGAWKPAQTAVNPQTKEMLAHDGKDWVPVPAKSKGVMGYIDDAVRSVANGMTLGWADELSAKANELIGRGTYDENVKAERAKNDQIHPAISIPGEVAGAMMVPIPGGAAASMGARMARGAGIGAAFGAVQGAGSGTDMTDRASRAAVGGVAGAALGGVAPPIVEGLIQGGTALARPVVNAVRGTINPEGEASRRVFTAMQRDAQADPNAVSRLTPQEFVASSQNGGPATIMDMGGDLTRRVADSAAITSPEGGTAINQAINNRFEGQAGRITDWLHNTFNFPNAQAQQAAIENVSRTVNRQAYDLAMRHGAGGVWDTELQRLAGAPAIQQAAEGAVPSLANRGIAEGFRAPRQNPLSFDPETGLASLSKLSDGSQRVPDLRFWDQVKRNLDGMIGTANRAGDNARVSELTGLKNELVSNLDRLVPSYARARAGAAHFFGAENALEAGQNFVTAKLSNQEARAALGRMTPQERQLFQDGFVSRFIDNLGETADRRSVLNKIAESPAARERLNMVLGQQRSAELETHLRVEGIMDLARGAVQGNSWTAKRLYDLGLAGGAGLGAHGGYNMDPKEMTYGAVLAAIASGGKHIDQRVAQRVAQLLVSNDPRMLQLGITIASRNSRILDNLRGVDRRIAGAAGEGVPKIGVSSAQMPAIGQADDQPEIPRPPGQ
jgi:hypothetical protein